MRVSVGAVAVVLLVLGCVSKPAHALTDEELFRQLRFNFVNPGGRSLGLAGAAIASVDDATAASTNPAALTRLLDNEFFAEYRTVDYSSDAFSSLTKKVGASPGFVVDNGEGGDPSSTGTIDKQNSPSFISFVFPWQSGQGKNRRRFALALSRQELLRYSGTVDQSFALGLGEPAWSGDDRVKYRSLGRVDRMDIVQYNATFAAQLTKNWSLGLTVSQANLKIDSRSGYDSYDPSCITPECIDNPRDPVKGVTAGSTTSMTGVSENALTYSIGLVWEPINYYRAGDPPIRLAVVYNRGARFDAKEQLADIDISRLADWNGELASLPTLPPREIPFTLKVPDRYGVGFRYHKVSQGAATRQLNWTVDVVGVKYDELASENYQTGVNYLTNPNTQAVTINELHFTIDNGIEYRTGLEWLSTSESGSFTFGVRGGYARLPANRIYLDTVSTSNPGYTEFLRQQFAKGEALDAICGGMTFMFQLSSKVRLQTDLGYQHTSESNQAVLSAILRF